MNETKKNFSGFCHGRSMHDRMLFLYLAKKIMEKFSKKYFRDHFFEDVLVLASKCYTDKMITKRTMYAFVN